MSQQADIKHVLDEHRQWLASGKQAGKRADLAGARLDDMDLSGVDLSAAVLKGASLKNTNLSGARLIHTDFSDACLQGARLDRTTLLLADFSGADLRQADLSDSIADPDQVEGQMRRGPKFKDADLQQANLTGAYCYISDFSGANLQGAKLEGTLLERANLSDNNLSAISLRGANLSGANLQRSDLSRSDLSDARLVHANLHRARLSRARLSGAQLQAANFDDSQVDGVSYDRQTLFRGIRVANCFGSARFRRFAQDQDFIEEFKEAHPYSYYVWLGLTDCGRSMLRVVLWSLCLAVGFGIIYFLLGEHAFAVSNKDTLSWSLFTSLYYSVVTFTTLGFGDITPRTPLAAALVMVEVIVGYLMLGILISILATKVARRS